MDWITLAIALCTGISLSAACGFRVFVPLLAVSAAVRYLNVPVNDTLAWVGSDAAFVCLLAATVVEVLAYYIPFVDHLLDTVSAPLALAAGAIITAGLLPEMPDYAQWGIGIIAGAGAAGAVQAGTTALRATSTVSTGGLGNWVVTTVENILSLLGSILAILLPVVAILGVLLLALMVGLIIRRVRRHRHATSTPAP